MFKITRADIFMSVVVNGLVAGLCYIVFSPAVGTAAVTPSLVPQIIAQTRPEMGAAERVFWERAVRESANGAGIPDDVWAATIATESAFSGKLISPSGAQGASQVMPSWRDKIAQCKGVNLLEIEPNLQCGAAILAYELKKDNNVDAALRRYNAGPRGESQAQAYADKTLARIARAQLAERAKPVEVAAK